METDNSDSINRTECITVLSLFDIPTYISEWLYDEAKAFTDLRTMRRIEYSQVETWERMYELAFEEDAQRRAVWTLAVTSNLEFVFKWIQSFTKTQGKCPTIQDFTPSSVELLPEFIGNNSHTEPNRISSYGNRFSYPRYSTTSIGSNSTLTSRRNVKISITDFPKFSGRSKDWLEFSRKFTSIANTQGMGYVLEEKEFQPSTPEEEACYKEDKEYIFSALKTLWGGKNLSLLTKHEKTKDGRLAYLGAQSYFRGEAQSDTLLQEAISDLMSNKLTPTTYDGAEGYNDNFNEAISSLDLLGYELPEKLVKSIYTNNITDWVYDTIKDSPSSTKLTLSELQSAILKKYISLQGERRPGAPAFKPKRRVNFMDTEVETNDTPNPDFDDFIHDIMATNTTTFPLLPIEKWKSLPDEVKQYVKDVNAYYKRKYPIKPNSTTKTKPLKRPVRNVRALSSVPLEDKNLIESQYADDNIEQDFTETPNDEPQELDETPVLADSVQQYFTNARSINVCNTQKTYNLPTRALNAHFTGKQKYGRLITDNAADTGCLSPLYCYITHKSDQEILVNGCHPGITCSYPIASGVTAIDLAEDVILVGQHEVPLIPDAKIMIISETQARDYGTEIDSKPLKYGGGASIVTNGGATIPLRMEQALMTCPIRKPTEHEMNTLYIHWLTADYPWDPASESEPLEECDIAPMGYNEPIRHGQFSKLNLTLTDLGELGELSNPFGEISQYEIDQAFRHLTNFKRGKPLQVHLQQTNKSIGDVEKYQSLLGWKPLDIIKKTLDATTQWAMTTYEGPMKRHFKSRFPSLNKPRLREMYATDTWFSSTPALGGYTCAQLYYGVMSKYIALYPMVRESQGPETLEDFCRYKGAPIKLKNDNAQMETGKTWTEICRKYNIEQCTTEPHHPWQNEAERYIQEVKKLTNTMMDRTGCPDKLWALCALHVVKIHNHLADKSLNWLTPIEVAFGYTPDISALLKFIFWEEVYFLESETSFPQSKERLGRFVGVADSMGDAMTFLIYNQDTDKIIGRSVVRSTNNPKTSNKRINNTMPRVVGMHDIHPNNQLPTIDPDKLLGTSFLKEHAGHQKRAIVKEVNQDGTCAVEYADGNEGTATYQEIINYLNKPYEEADDLWSFDRILSHKTTKDKDGSQGIYVQVLWDSGEKTWEHINTIKQDDPVTLAQYAKDKKLTDQIGWKWARRYLKNPKRFIRITRQIHLTKRQSGPIYKFGVQVPRNVKEAILLDQQNKNTLWQDAIKKEMDKIVEYKVFSSPSNNTAPLGYKRIPCHIIFDVKFNTTRKARFVAGGHMTDDPGEDSYSGVIAPEAVRLGMFAAVHDALSIVAADIGNAYLYAKTNEKVYTILGEEYGAKMANKILVFEKCLYGLKTSGARFHEHLSDTLRDLGFKPTKADADLWMKDLTTHYEYIARYVDDILVFSKKPDEIIDKLKQKYFLQGIGTPEYYLGADFKLYKKGEVETITVCAKTYVTNVCKQIEELIGIPLKGYETPMASDDHPELDDSGFLNNVDHSKYRMLIGSGQWAINLSRFDIMYAIQTLAQYAAAPREGHLKRALRVFGYLKHYPKYGIIFDSAEKEIPDSKVEEVNWKEQYPGASEELPKDMPKPMGKPVTITVFVDADHASERVTRRSVTGILLFVNSTPIKWYSKKQNTVETSTYGAELVALRIAVEMIIEYRYKLRMMGIPVKGPAKVYCDNKSVVLNMTLPSSSLKKKHNAIAYHKVRECVAAGIVEIHHIQGKENVADILTKVTDVGTFKKHVKTCLISL